MTKQSQEDFIYIDLCRYLHGKMLLKEVCAKHNLKHSRAVHLANRIVNYTPQIKNADNIYKTSKMTVEEYMEWKNVDKHVNKKVSYVEEEIETPMDNDTRRRVMEFINLQSV